VFGRSESFLYAFTWNSSAAIVSYLDKDGKSIWQYSTPDSDKDCSNTITYKQIDAETDMVIATSGYMEINYNRIIHSSR
jgi:hypothetical protein